MLISIRTTWSIQEQIITGFPRRYKNLRARLRVPTRTAVRQKRLSCWCVTEPALGSKDAGTEHKHDLHHPKGPLKTTADPTVPVFSITCRFGNPFILYLERTVTWDVLQKEILEKMRHLLRPGVFVQVSSPYICSDPWIRSSFKSHSWTLGRAVYSASGGRGGNHLPVASGGAATLSSLCGEVIPPPAARGSTTRPPLWPVHLKTGWKT